MKTWFLIISVFSVSYYCFAQNQSIIDSKKNELKLNTLFLIGGYPELSFERALGKKFAIGISLGAFIGSAGPNYATDILTADVSILPYFRYYFGKRRTAGLFLENNINISSREGCFDRSQEWGVGLGLGAGYKHIVGKSWSIELIAGGGFNTVQESCANSSLFFPDMYSRLGVTIAKRF